MLHSNCIGLFCHSEGTWSRSISLRCKQLVLSIHTLSVHYRHTTDNVNWSFSKYMKLHVHIIFWKIALCVTLNTSRSAYTLYTFRFPSVSASLFVDYVIWHSSTTALQYRVGARWRHQRRLALRLRNLKFLLHQHHVG